MGERVKKYRGATEILRDRYYRGKSVERLAEANSTMQDLALGDQIRTLREIANLTQADLAQLISTQPTQISRIEDADYEGHSVATLRRIAKALHMRLKIEFVTDDSGGCEARAM